MKNDKWRDSHYYREIKKAKEFADTCNSLGLSQSAVINLLIDDWMLSKEEFLEAKISLIRSNARKSKLTIDNG